MTADARARFIVLPFRSFPSRTPPAAPHNLLQNRPESEACFHDLMPGGGAAGCQVAFGEIEPPWIGFRSLVVPQAGQHVKSCRPFQIIPVFLGRSESKILHAINCGCPKKEVKIFKSLRRALSEGYSPCPVIKAHVACSR